MIQTNIGESGYFQEIIKLQLKKPKNWKWELSTSKSSPHIALPTIQLFNSKGQLLIQTDNSIPEGKKYHTYYEDDFKNATPNNISINRLERCKSDIYPKRPSQLLQRTLKKSTSGKVYQGKESYKETDSPKKLSKYPTRRLFDDDDELENIITNISKSRGGRKLQKSRSDVLYEKCREKYTRGETKNFPGHFNGSPGEFERTAQLKDSTNHHKRTRSDDLFQRTMKYNEESLRRAITDGYRNFITPHLFSNSKHHHTKNDINNNETSDSDDLKNRYTTRTSSAGTLIILEETFNNTRRRRRRKSPNKNPNTKEQSDKQSLIKLPGGEQTIEQHPVSFPSSNAPSDQYTAGNTSVYNKLITSKQEREEEESGEKFSFHSHGDVFPIKELPCDSPDNECCDFTTYTVQEPVTSGSDNKNRAEKNGGGVSLERKRRRKVFRKNGTNSYCDDAEKRKANTRTGNTLSARLVNRNKANEDDSDLLRLVRHLSTDHVKMGANVSRHSSKGLSGRRSQSSGSICNGKGRHGSTSGENKICGSLPSYLDDRDSTSCNNNHHDCEKPPLDEIQRIPPLGDGAPLHWKFSDNQIALCDQGYGSERSPEEEYPPPLPEHDNQCHHHLEPHACYPFITPESTFSVTLAKGSRGLGLSVTGGIDSGGSWPGLIRVKRLFPHQPAAACGLLNVGDLLLEANGITLTGLTNYEALEVLRTTPNQVELRVCRPPPDVLSCVSPISEVPPPPPRREPPNAINLLGGIHGSPEDDYYHGDFEVILSKIQGSLGFTLRKEDDSALGHYIRALVREPALSDGRIRAGDKIIAVNDVEISSMTHEQAVQFLRQCGDIVKLRLYRDASQTPVAALSPTETTPRTSFSKKTHLRQEAVDMLNDIAVRKLIPGNQETYRRSLSPNASPRRLRRQACPSDASHIIDPSDKYLITDEQFHEGLLQKCSIPFDDESFNSLFSVDSDEYDKPSRPSSLDLYNPNRTPVAARKPKFNFSLAHNAYELNNLDAEVLDAPNLTYNLGNDDGNSTEVECGDSFPQEPASMPHIPTEKPGFSYKNPAYQSAHPQCGAAEASDEKTNGKPDDSNIKKWKGVVLTADENKPDKKEKAKDDYEILAIELNRGWNSRLGFSLQGAAGVTYVSAVHADSVAARDGRLKAGDRVIKVNDESVEHMSTNEIIDLLRIVRGPVCIVVCRLKSKEDCTKSNAEN